MQQKEVWVVEVVAVVEHHVGVEAVVEHPVGVEASVVHSWKQVVAVVGLTSVAERCKDPLEVEVDLLLAKELAVVVVKAVVVEQSAPVERVQEDSKVAARGCQQLKSSEAE